MIGVIACGQTDNQCSADHYLPAAVVSQTQILVTAIEGRAASSGALFEQFWAGFCQKDARSAVALALSGIIAAVCCLQRRRPSDSASVSGEACKSF